MIIKYNDFINEDYNFSSFINEEFKFPEVFPDMTKKGEIIKDKVYEYLQIAKEKANDPENIKKLNDFLDSVEQTTTKVSDIMKKDRNIAIVSNLLNFGKWGALITGIYQVIFNSVISFSHFELGGVGAFKIALFLYVLNIIITVFRKYNNLVSVVREIKNFVTNIINILKGTKGQIHENYILCLEKYKII